MRWGAKAKPLEVSTNHLCCAISLTHRCVQKLPQNPPTIVPATTSPKNQVIEPKSNEGVAVGSRPAIPLTDIGIQNLSENSQTAVPTTANYITATGKEVLKVLQSAAAVIPVSLLQEAIGVVLKIMRGALNSAFESWMGFHQDASAVEQKVKDLQERVSSHLMINILHHVIPKSEEGNNDAVVKIVKGIEEDIKQLLRCAPTNCGPRSLLIVL